MRKLTKIISYPPPTGYEISQFERDQDIRLPDELKEFLLQQNVLSAEESLFIQKGKIYIVHHFFPWSSESELSIDRLFIPLKSFLSKDYVAFADDQGGWFYVISLSNDTYGQVYFCRTDEELPQALTLLSESLSIFLEELQPNPYK